MRCYFMRNGHIASVEELPGLSDQEAIETGRRLYEARRKKHNFEGFEIWDRTRIVIQDPAPAPAPPTVGMSEDEAEGDFRPSRDPATS